MLKKRKKAEVGKLLNALSRLDMCLLVVQRKSGFIWLSYEGLKEQTCTHTNFLLMRGRFYLFICK